MSEYWRWYSPKRIIKEHGKGLFQNWAGEGSTQWKSAAAIQWPCCPHWLWAAWPAAFYQKYLLHFWHCHWYLRIPVFVLSVAQEFEARFFSCTVIDGLLNVPEVYAFQFTRREYGLRELALQTDTGAPGKILTAWIATWIAAHFAERCCSRTEKR